MILVNFFFFFHPTNTQTNREDRRGEVSHPLSLLGLKCVLLDDCHLQKKKEKRIKERGKKNNDKAGVTGQK